MNIDLKLGDCLEVLKTIPDNSVDSVVTDSPYGLSFMNKHWDYDVPSVEIWTECLRVLKPGGHLLSFAGSRTYHRMAVRIEDAGFEIRDQIMYIYGSGFPKSHNIGKALDKIIDEKERTEQKTEHNLRCVPNSNLQETELTNQEQGEILLPRLSQQNMEQNICETTHIVGGEQSSLEGWNNIKETERELQRSKVCEMSEGVFGNGEEGRICDGTQISNGNETSTNIDENGSSSSHRPQSRKQQNRKPNVISEQLTTQEIREIRERFDGYGSSLKPAHEPIVLARKPLSEKSIAENVLKHGTGGINIDGSRIGTTDNLNGGGYGGNNVGVATYALSDGRKTLPTNKLSKDDFIQPEGRFPANIIFDEEAGKILDQQSDKASRFFYCPKTSKKERNEGLDHMEDRPSQLNSGGIGRKISVEKRLDANGENAPTMKNNHPTVKPTDLMRYLINLVTPKGGTTLDPFMGSGSTGKAAVRCGVNFIGIEREQEYMDIAKARIEHEKNKPVQGELL